jgi:hypothetical protein
MRRFRAVFPFFLMLVISTMLTSCRNRVVDPPPPVPWTHLTDEWGYLSNTYFWLTDVDQTNDSIYSVARRPVFNYRENYRRFDSNRNHVAIDQEWFVDEIKVYVSDPTNDRTLPFGRAATMEYLADLDLNDSQFVAIEDINHTLATWKKLTNNEQYAVDMNLGYIRLVMPVPEYQMVACAFRIQGDTSAFGSLDVTAGSPVKLVMLKSARCAVNSQMDLTWNLMFRHVYSLRRTNIDPYTMKMRIGRRVTDEQFEFTPPGINLSYLTFFGLDREDNGGTSGSDGVVDNIPAIFNPLLGELHFLDLTPFAPSGLYHLSNSLPDTSVGNLWFLQLPNDSLNIFVCPAVYRFDQHQGAAFGSRWSLEVQ